MSRSLECHRNTARTRRMKRGGRSATSCLLLEAAEHACDGAGEPQPAVELGLRRASSLSRQRVELGGALVFRGKPFGLDQTLFFHAIERRVKQALLDMQRIVVQLMPPRLQ